MERFLVVGCGGSGGATLAYMMDHLLGLLKTKGINSLPAGWQFLHVDVPVGEEAGPSGLRNVGQAGGGYVSTGTAASAYATVDSAVSGRLQNKLDLLGSWAPQRPGEVMVPVQNGAGQFRAIGRVLTLSRVQQVRTAFVDAITRMASDEANKDMGAVARTFVDFGGFNARQPPITLVISSMAGGAGASMALDVCRILSTVQGINPLTTAVFMLSPDTFEGLAKSERLGVGPNALAMLGEIVAAQSGAAAGHDKAILGALGLANTPADVPFARVFPVGRHIGSDDGAVLGGPNGRPTDVYRALGRGLASLMTSGSVALEDFTSYDLGNPDGTAFNRVLFGWGATNPMALQWHSFGYASVSTGRDRYAHYAAQRLARAAVDRLLYGHRTPGDTLGDQDQIRRLADSQWEVFVGKVGLPSTVNAIPGWLMEGGFPRDHQAQVNQVVEGLRRIIPSPNGQPGQAWAMQTRTRLDQQRDGLKASLDGLATSYAWIWHETVLERTQQQVGEYVSRLGLPFTKELLVRLSRHVTEFVGKELTARPQTVVDSTAEATAAMVVGSLDQRTVQGGDHLVEKVLGSIRGKSMRLVEERATTLLGKVLFSYASGVLAPLITALEESQRLLEQQVLVQAQGLGVVDLRTQVYRAWPTDDSTKPADRFYAAQNEVLLTSADEFPEQFVTDLVGALGEAFKDSAPDEVRGEVLAQVIRGEWATTSQTDKAPQGLVEQSSGWRCDAFRVDPNGNVLVPRKATFRVVVDAGTILDRATGFIRRPGESFDRFISMSLRDYVMARDVSGASSVVTERSTRVDVAFDMALQQARPLIGVNNEAVLALFANQSVQYRYKFSAVPFAALPIANVLADKVGKAGFDPTSASRLAAATMVSDTRSISIFSSYEKYPPLAYGSMLDIIANQWHSSDYFARKDFWKWRRSRPLPAALPVADVERRALIAGWFIARIVGHLRIPFKESTKPVQVWSQLQQAWLSFPNPLLTPPERFGGPLDWMPAVLESVLLANVFACQEPVFGSLLPFQTLREKYDEGQDPWVTNSQTPLAGLELLTSWLRTGVGPSPSHVPGVQQAMTASDRADATKTWLSRMQAQAQHFRDSVPEQRDDAAKLPLFSDLADDTYQVTKMLGDLISQAATKAEQTDSGLQVAPPVMETPAADGNQVHDYDGLEG